MLGVSFLPSNVASVANVARLYSLEVKNEKEYCQLPHNFQKSQTTI
jgi:hypothetical protein